jgi:hypothetical protein
MTLREVARTPIYDRFVLGTTRTVQLLQECGLTRTYGDFEPIAADDLPDTEFWDPRFRRACERILAGRKLTAAVALSATLPFLGFGRVHRAAELLLEGKDEVRAYQPFRYVFVDGKTVSGDVSGALVPGFAAWRFGIAAPVRVGYCPVDRMASLDAGVDAERDMVEAIDYSFH